MAEQSDALVEVYRLIRKLMDAARTHAWNKGWDQPTLERVYNNIFEHSKPPIELDPMQYITWQHMFPFRGHARNYIKVTDEINVTPPSALHTRHIHKIEQLFRELNILEENEETPLIGGSAKDWLKFLTYLLSKFHQSLPVRAPQPSAVHTLIHLPLGSHFVGRAQFLIDLRKTLLETTTAPNLSVVVIHGLGGMGKTRVSEEYAYKYLNEYKYVLFVNADTEDNLRSDIIQTAQNVQLGISQNVSTYEQAISALGQWLPTHGPWLIIFDNVDTDDAAHAVGQLFPKLRGGHVLITARISDWGHHNIARPELPKLTIDDAETYLLQATNEHGQIEASDKVDARGLAQRLGCVPSLLAYAAAYIKHNPMSFRDYEADWLKNYKSLNWLDEKRAHRLAGYPTPEAAATWLTSFEKLSTRSRNLIQSFAWFGPEPIPFSLVSHNKEAARALVELQGYSFITKTKDTPSFTINSALQDIERIKQTAERQTQPLADAAKLIELGFIKQQTQPLVDAAQKQSDLLVPHAMKVLHYLHDDMNSEAADLLDSVGRLAVLAMPNIKDLEGEALRYIVSVLGDFYEVEPLEPILAFLAKDRAKWETVHTPLLDTNNFVLRYGMSEALADEWNIEEISALLKKAQSLNEFELAGYALGLAYARDPKLIDPKLKLIDPKLLTLLANRPAYSGCSILGDLFLSLVFKKIEKARQSKTSPNLGDQIFGNLSGISFSLTCKLLRPRKHCPTDDLLRLTRTIQSSQQRLKIYKRSNLTSENLK